MKKKSKLKEYSKKAIAAMIILWFIVAVFGMGVIIYQLKHSFSPENVSLDTLFNYVGMPMTGGIITYLLKSAIENNQKIKSSISNTIDKIKETVIEKG